MIYVYIKGDRYNCYSVQFEGNDIINAFQLTFDTIEQLTNYIMQFSNVYSIPVQYYI